MKKEIQNLISNKGIGDEIRFYGEATKEEIKGAFKLVDIFNDTIDFVKVQIKIKDKAEFYEFKNELYYCDSVIMNNDHNHNAIYMVECL